MHRPSVCACACPDSNRDAKARRSERRVSANSTTGAYETNRSSCPRQVRPAGLEPATSSFGGSRSAPAELRTLALSLLESNQRPRVYQTRALPAELRDIAKRLEGVEPPASGFVARRSLRLSYRRTVQKPESLSGVGRIRTFNAPKGPGFTDRCAGPSRASPPGMSGPGVEPGTRGSSGRRSTG